MFANELLLCSSKPNPLIIGAQWLRRAVRNVNLAKRRWTVCHASSTFYRNKLTCVADVEWAADMIGNTADVFDMQIGLMVAWLTSASTADPDRCRHYDVCLMSWPRSQLVETAAFKRKSGNTWSQILIAIPGSRNPPESIPVNLWKFAQKSRDFGIKSRPR